MLRLWEILSAFMSFNSRVHACFNFAAFIVEIILNSRGMLIVVLFHGCTAY